MAAFQTFGRANKEEPAHFQFTSMFQCQIYRNMAAKLTTCSCVTCDFLNLVRFHTKTLSMHMLNAKVLLNYHFPFDLRPDFVI